MLQGLETGNRHDAFRHVSILPGVVCERPPSDYGREGGGDAACGVHEAWPWAFRVRTT